MISLIGDPLLPGHGTDEDPNTMRGGRKALTGGCAENQQVSHVELRINRAVEKFKYSSFTGAIAHRLADSAPIIHKYQDKYKKNGRDSPQMVH
jgi:hypothetical protein